MTDQEMLAVLTSKADFEGTLSLSCKDHNGDKMPTFVARMLVNAIEATVHERDTALFRQVLEAMDEHLRGVGYDKTEVAIEVVRERLKQAKEEG